MDKHLKLYVLVDLVGSCHSLVESNQGFPVVVLGNWVEGGKISHKLNSVNVLPDS